MIMVIEDDDDIRELLKMALEMEGYVVQTAENGKKALDILNSGSRPQLVLLDLNMPGMSGQEMLLHLRTIPTIVLSAASKTVLQGISNVRGVLQKPVDLKILYQRIEEVLSTKLKKEMA